MKKWIQLFCILLWIIATFFWVEYRSNQIALEAIRVNEKENLEKWKKMMFPLYSELGVSYSEDPHDMQELMTPIFQITEPSEVIPLGDRPAQVNR